MEFNLNSKELEKLLSKVIPAVPTRTPMAILENFLFEIDEGKLSVYSTDLEISLRSSMQITAEEKIKIVVPAHLLYDVVRSLSETQIKFETETNSKLKITTDNGTYSLGYSSPEEFPSIPEVTAEDEININGKELKKAIDLTSFAISKEDMRPAMTGILFEFTNEGINFVATDGHRLVKYTNKKINKQSEEQFIIPERAINVLSKLLTENDIKTKFSKTNISFSIGEVEFISRLIAEKYPAYNSVIPLENENELKINKNEILSTIRRMSLFSTTNTKQVKFSINENSLEVTAEDIDSGSSAKEQIECEYSGEPMDIGFNTTYIHDILTHISDDEIVFKLHSSTKACIIKPTSQKEDEELMLLLMPVRLNG